MEAKRKELTLDELEQLRQAGKPIESSEVIVAKRAARAKKKAEQAKRNALGEAERAVAQNVRCMFSSEESTKQLLKQLQEKIRNQRKTWLSKGITEATLPSDLRTPYIVAFEILNYNHYRKVMGPLAIEGLKIQDKEVKKYTYNFVDNLLAKGFVDMGWVISLLNKKYVSRYGWALLRKHSALLANPGGNLLGDILDEWADDPDTWKKWERLASEDGLPVDMRKLYPRTWRK